MAGTVLDLDTITAEDSLASDIATQYQTWEQLRRPWAMEKQEVRDYVYATDTTKTGNSTLPWMNKTTIPKLTQIKENLKANYMAALFSSDDWLHWEGESEEDEAKSEVIVSYMKNKTRQIGFENRVSELLDDYIDTGNAFVMAVHDVKSTIDEAGIKQNTYVGPNTHRFSPMDIVFNPQAPSFDEAPKIVRYIKSLGEIKAMVEDNPADEYMAGAFEDMLFMRKAMAGISQGDSIKGHHYQIDGFADIRNYYGTDYAEILEFHGDLYHRPTDTMYRNHIITIADRRKVLRLIPNPSWTGTTRIKHAGWRKRPDNLYAMGPLDNIVGMQYRIDHLENLKADAFDMIAFPMMKIVGTVEEFNYGPNEVINIGEDGDVTFLHPPSDFLQADTQIAILERKMEEFAGAPSETLGIRTPGEKTAFEVSQLQNAASRIFQNKIQNFEETLLLPLLNDMLEQSRRNLDVADNIRVIDDEFGTALFQEVSREDLSAKGTLRPVGARHFVANANLVQTLNQLFNSAIGSDPAVNTHISGKKIAHLMEDALELKKHELVQDNIRVVEQLETQQLINAGEEQILDEQAVAAEEATNELG